MPRLEASTRSSSGRDPGLTERHIFCAEEGAAALTRETGGDATFIGTDLADAIAIERDAGGEANLKILGAADQHQCPCVLARTRVRRGALGNQCGWPSSAP